MSDAVIVATGRTAIGRAYKGSLVDVRPDDLQGFVMKNVIENAGIDPTEIDDIVVGNTQPFGEANAMNTARGATFLAGFPDTIPGTTVNRFCGSSLQAIRIAAHAIKAGDADTCLAVGVESTTRTMPEDGGIVPHPAFVGPSMLCDLYIAMGLTAEEVAERFNVSREESDRFAQQSQERAVAAQKSGFFEREILPYVKPDGTMVDIDDGPRPGSTYEKLAQLSPVFKEGGTVTAGNSCPLNDGAAAVLLMSEEKAKAVGLTPLARVHTSAVSGLAPEIMGVGPIAAVLKVLDRSGLSMRDIDVVELNEAFAAQVLAVAHELKVDPFSPQLNPHGGAIALGHPFGATGCRIMTTLLNDLQTLDGVFGIETMCIGTGQGIAMLVERLS